MSGANRSFKVSPLQNIAPVFVMAYPRSYGCSSRVVVPRLNISLLRVQPDGQRATRRGRHGGDWRRDVNIVGHGIDLVDIAELRRWVEDPRDPLIPRCFVREELDEIGAGQNRIERLAGRFAAKEAVLKALGTGFGDGVAFTDVVIHRAACGPPQVRLSGGA